MKQPNCKKYIFIITLTILCLLKGAVLFAIDDRIENFDCLYLGSNIKTVVKDNFTYTESVETLKDIIYLIETSYVGYEDMLQRGFNEEQFMKNIEPLFNDGIRIHREKLFDYICDNIKPYVCDSHFNITFSEMNEKSFSQKELIYLSDIYLKKTKSDYKVIKADNLPYGTKLNLPEENLFKTIYKGREVYRVGMLSPAEGNYNSITLPVFIENKRINITCNYVPERFYTNEFKFIETDKSAYINIPSFSMSADDFNEFSKLGKKVYDKKNLIIDLRQNGGGNPLYFCEFLFDLYGGKENVETYQKIFKIENRFDKVMTSPLIIQQQVNDTEDTDLDIFETADSNGHKFTGRIIFLTSKASASCSEYMIIVTKNLFDNVVTVGTNTMGALHYGNPFVYRLKNSGLLMSVPETKLDINDFQEGIGLMPDYVTSGDVENIIKYMTKDTKLVAEIF